MEEDKEDSQGLREEDNDTWKITRRTAARFSGKRTRTSGKLQEEQNLSRLEKNEDDSQGSKEEDEEVRKRSIRPCRDYRI